MMDYDGEMGDMEAINPSEHLHDLNLRQKATLAMAVANQTKYDALRAEYRKELAALDAKYKLLEIPIFEERCKIIHGEQGLEDLKIEAEKLEEMKDQEALLPNFWFHTLRNCDTVRGVTGLNDDDKECMSYIRDIVVEALPIVEEEIEVEDECCCGDEECECKKEKEEKKEGEEKEEKKEEGEEKKEEKEKHKITVQKNGFKIIFHFKEGNPYFPERELSKTFHLVQQPTESEPGYDRIEVVKPTWNEGKNLTVKRVTKTVKVKGKGKGKGKKPATKKVTTEEPCESFFNFFSTPEVPEDTSELEEEEAAELEQAIQMELAVGQTLCEDVIPRAVLWYTGAACEDDEGFGDFGEDDEDEDDEDGEDGEDDEDEDEDDEEENEDEEEEEEGGKNTKKAPAAQNQETPEECKQQ